MHCVACSAWRSSGAQRDDFAANNAMARMARERFGELSQEVLDGGRRSRSLWRGQYRLRARIPHLQQG